MRNPLFYVVLLALIVLDGWLLAHPNLIGRAGVFFFDYDYLNTFPKALGTVLAVAGVALLVSWLLSRAGGMVGKVGLGLLVGVSTYWLLDSFDLYNSGVYKLTGAGFRAGAILLPGLLLLIFFKSSIDVYRAKPNRR